MKTKSKLMSSLLVLALCVTMFAGSTYAWFSDEVVSGRNTIESGNLDVELQYSTDGTNWADVTETTDVFANATASDLWEPGHTEVVALKIKNAGTLAAKLDLAATIYSETPGTNVYGDTFKLSDYLDVHAITMDALYGQYLVAHYLGGRDASATLDKYSFDADLINEETILLPDAEMYSVIRITMPETVENEANHKTGTTAPSIEFGIKLVANQQVHEKDGFSNDYDKLAPKTKVATAAELKTALAAGESVALTADVTVAETLVVSATGDVTIDLNGNDLSYAVSNSGASAIINNKGDLNITGEGTISFVAENPDLGAIPAYATNTITNTGTLVIGKGVTVTNGSDGGASYAVDNHGVFTLDGGTLIGDRCALRIARYNQDDVQFTMNSGTVTAKTPAWIQLPGSDSAAAPKITVKINGGTFQSTKATSADNNVLYTYSYGNSHANTSITINGGEFLGGTVSIGSGYKGDAPALTINGGTFEYNVLQWLEGDTSTVLYDANK